MQKYVAKSVMLLVFMLSCEINAMRSLFVKPMDYNYSVKNNAPEAQYTKYTTENMPPKLSKSIVTAQQAKNQKFNIDDFDTISSDVQPVTVSQPHVTSWKDFLFRQNILKKPESVARLHGEQSEAMSLMSPDVFKQNELSMQTKPSIESNFNQPFVPVRSVELPVLIEPVKSVELLKTSEFSENQPLQDVSIALPARQNVGDVVKQQILDKIPTLAVEDLNKIAELIRIIKEADVKTSGQLMGLKEYKAVKDNLYPEGLPTDVSPKLLFEISKSSVSKATPIIAMSEIQQGKQLEAVKPLEQVKQLYVFDSVSAMMKARTQVRNDAQNRIKQSIENQVVAKFDKDAWQENFKTENQIDVGQPGFDQMMQHNMDKELQNQIDLAYEDNNARIDVAGDEAVAIFNSKVDAATKAKNASVKSQSKNNNGVSKLMNQAKINEIKSSAVKKQKSLIDKDIEQQFVAQGFYLEIPRDNGFHDMMVLTKSKWMEIYARWHPKAPREEVVAKVNEILTKLQDTAYKTPKNAAAIKSAQDQAVVGLQVPQVQVVAKTPRALSPVSVVTGAM
ncbi:MAG: hypothetical protein Q8Q60_02110 [Candidatus Chromulinivorax sp.]|nr:hypothetical protein [Candidatus Chromulinivorax sp.]